jgi:putative hydrolase of the HAD superfamily
MTNHDVQLMRDKRIAAVEGLALERFRQVETWVFDLDNTLYPPDSPLWPQIDDRITAYLMELYGHDGITSRALQKHFYHKHGTTLKALLDRGEADADDFLAFVHDIDRSGIAKNPLLSEALARLPGRKLILTNGSERHAQDTADALGILHHFEAIYDIKAANFVPKPDAANFQRFFDLHDVRPDRAVMFEDLVKNLEAPKAFGMQTVLIVPETGRGDWRDDVEKAQIHPAFVDHVTDNLPGFLAALPVQ